ncbi:flagellar biosynthesis protein FlhA [Vibrio marisflavi]|uniref:Flagellar biosynthesis protein FlhA n=1 Tax=Vibrio marisflavi CECT 7928 TaxID=634439 RepID=A0ABN8E6T2_9VIBR|nr:flagellar biosynthesis protein FlhA [Vibrio marisflavi]CAH0540091.1 Flagellar biosynthesis protein FlhA [Vibrio marisflavi CECT 7928]
MKEKLITTFSSIQQRKLGIPIFVLMVLAMVILPIPTWMLDVLFTFNITLSLIVLLVAAYALKPLDFSIFPTVLLITTLLRLSLNIASTRVVLLHGHTGSEAAGQVIHAFGQVVIGGNYVVGIVVFAILMIINFIVVTNGSGRISEVTARFTLDAMPGKQMAIDADLNSGVIDQIEAKRRRAEVAKEADFYGSMDGSSKFVKGDAIAALLILLINLIGGTVIGMMQYDMGFANAFETFSLLSIGDGLVAQIPALLLSVSAAIMVTRISDANDIGGQISLQLFGNPRVPMMVAILLIVIGLVPSMPHLAFVGFGLLIASIAYLIKRSLPDLAQLELDEQQEKTVQEMEVESHRELNWHDIPIMESLSLELGYRLVPLVDANQGGELMSRIKGIRKTLSQRYGFLLPTVRVRDNLNLSPEQYRIKLRGVDMAGGVVEPDKMMALNPGEVFGELEGKVVKDPAYGLNAYWIDPVKQEVATAFGYSLIDPASVITTHMRKVMIENLAELLHYDEVQQMVNQLSKISDSLQKELVPEKLSIGQVQKVFRLLLREDIPLTDLLSIATTLNDSADMTKDPVLLSSEVRKTLGRFLVYHLVGSEPELTVATLSADLEKLLMQAYNQAFQAGNISPENIVLEPSVSEQLQQHLPLAVDQLQQSPHTPILLVAPQLRPLMSRICRIVSKELKVIAFSEVPEDKRVNIVVNVG